jgi:hypothetical protein
MRRALPCSRGGVVSSCSCGSCGAAQTLNEECGARIQLAAKDDAGGEGVKSCMPTVLTRPDWLDSLLGPAITSTSNDEAPTAWCVWPQAW